MTPDDLPDPDPGADPGDPSAHPTAAPSAAPSADPSADPSVDDGRTNAVVTGRDGRAPDERVVLVTREPVELFKILKFEGLTASGGEAKAAIAAGRVTVNGVVETRKRRKIVADDVLGFGDLTCRVRRV